MEASSSAQAHYIIISQTQMQNHYQTAITLIHIILKITQLLSKQFQNLHNFYSQPPKISIIDTLSSTLSQKCNYIFQCVAIYYFIFFFKYTYTEYNSPIQNIHYPQNYLSSQESTPL